MRKKQVNDKVTDFESFKDKNGIQICSGDKVHFCVKTSGSSVYIYPGVVKEIKGRFCHITYNPYGTDDYTTKIQNHNCSARVIILEGEMLNNFKKE